MTARVKLPQYLLPENGIRLDPISDEVYIVQSPREDFEDVTNRLAQHTKSYDSKLYPWMRQDHDHVWKKAVIVNRNPTFQIVSKNRALSISERVSRPTKASLFRTVDEDGRTTRESSAASTNSRSTLMRSQSFSYDSRVQVPNASARPDRPILRTASRQKRSRESTAKTQSPPRNVRFQSPLPAMPSRTVSRLSIASSQSRVSSFSTISSASSSSLQVKGSTQNNDGNNQSKTDTKNASSASADESSPASAGSTRGGSSPSNASRKSINNKENSAKSNKKHGRGGGSPSPENKNMELVLNFFSKLPPV